ncbi:MAG: MBOAT family protein [Acidobacteriota bacterium]
MVFSSHLFLFVFLPLALAVYWTLPRRAKNLGLVLLSYIFYGWENPAFVVLMAASTVVDYGCGLVLAGARPGLRSRGEAPALLDEGGTRSRRQRIALCVSIASNLSLLGFFKYFDFGVDSWNRLAVALGADAATSDAVLRIVLPLGISFYTFQSMSYTIDVYRGRCRALRDPIDFACFVAMFPQLVAGPIVRFREIADQLEERRHSLAKAARGVSFFALGLAKKVLLANPCGKVADLAFDAATRTPLDAWLGALAYAFQIYFDFSGYSDMAIGLGLLLGFTLPKNFDSPYRARSVTDFWRRWHMSLSRWLRDYLYIPLGGNRKGPRRTYVNLMLVMLLGGLWHGAAWTFVVWGGMHGVALAVERAFGIDRGARSGERSGPRHALGVATTFVFVLFTWVVFRAPTLGDAILYWRDMLGLGLLGTSSDTSALVAGALRQTFHLGALLLAALIVWTAPQTDAWTRRLTAPRAALTLLLFAAAVLLMETQGYNPFIYFIF